MDPLRAHDNRSVGIHHKQFEDFCVLTPRLALVPLAESDAPFISSWRSDDWNSSQFLSDHIPSVDEQISWTRSPRWNRSDYLIWHLGDSVRLGTVSLANIVPNERSAVKGTMIGDASYRKQGLAYEANVGWLQYAFSGLQLKTLHALIREGNRDSFALNTRIGLEHVADEYGKVHEERGLFKPLVLQRERYEQLQARGHYSVPVRLIQTTVLLGEKYPEIAER